MAKAIIYNKRKVKIMSKVYRCTGTDKNKGRERGRGGCKIEWSDREFDIFEELCAKFCDQKEIANIMCVSLKALNRICKEHYFDSEDGRPMSLSEVQDRFRCRGYLRVREKQWEAIEKGNTTMLLWYGKNYLGQKDNPTVDNSLEEIKNNVNSLSDILTAPKENRIIEDF